MRNGNQDRHPLDVYVLGGTISCDEHEVKRSKKKGGPKKVLLPEPGKIHRMIEEAVPDSVMDKMKMRSYSEADPLVDSAECHASDLMKTVQEVRTITRRKSNILIASGTDNVVYLMHALAEGVRPEQLGDNNIIVVVSQTHAPNLADNADAENVWNTNMEPIDNLTNAIHLSSRPEMQGRIGLYCGGELLPPRGLVKVDTANPQPFRCRFRNIADSERPPERDWYINPRKNQDIPRGKEHPYVLADGVEGWGFDPLSDYGNLPAAMEGMILRRNGGSGVSAVIRAAIDKAMRRPGSGRKTDFNAMVVQAPGSGNLRQNEDELACVNEAGEIGLYSDIPVVLISDPLQSLGFGDDDSDLIYGGDFDLMREHLDKAAGGMGKSPVLSGGKLSRAEAKLLVSQAVMRGKRNHKLKGQDLLDYVQKTLIDYESFLRGEEV